MKEERLLSTDLSTDFEDNLTEAVGRLVDTGRGRLRILQCQPPSLLRRASRTAADWIAETLSPDTLPVGTTAATPFGPAFVARTARDAETGEKSTPLPAPTHAAETEIPILGVVDAETVRAEIEAAAGFAAQARAAGTRRAYETDWKAFAEWCRVRGLPYLPATAAGVATFLASEAGRGLAPPTLRRRLAAIRAAHRAAGLVAPQDLADGAAVAEVMAGIERDRLHRPRQAEALTPDLLARLVARLDGRGTPLRRLRDRAAVLMGFAGALRRSELLALQREDITIADEGAVLLVRKGKTDQAGKGARVRLPRAPGSPLCAVAALEAWLAESGLVEGPLFRRISKAGRLLDRPLSQSGFVAILKEAAARAGLDAARISGHSLRRGWMTAAARAGAGLDEMMGQARQVSPRTALGYVAARDDFDGHVGRRILGSSSAAAFPSPRGSPAGAGPGPVRPGRRA
jgi:integrase